MDKISGDLLFKLNDLIDILVDLREAVAAFDKAITDKLHPLPLTAVEKPPKKERKPRVKKQLETGLKELVVLEKIPTDSAGSEASSDSMISALRTCCGSEDGQ